MSKLKNFFSQMKTRLAMSSRKKSYSQDETFDSSSEIQPKSNKRKSKVRKNTLSRKKPTSQSDFLEKLFSPSSRPTIHKVFLLFFFASLFYFSARTIGLILIPPESMIVKSNNNFFADIKNKTASNIQSLTEIDPFKALGKLEDKKPEDEQKDEEPVICLDSDRKSSLSIELLSTLVLQDTIKSIAAVQMRGKNEILSLREGEKFQNLAEIGKITRRKLVFKNLQSGRCEYIDNEEEEIKGRLKESLPQVISDPKEAQALLDSKQKAQIENKGNTYKIKKTLRDEMLSNIGEVLTQAKAISIKNSDGTLSYKMQDVVPGSIYSQLNIGDGDIITEINGNKIKNLAELMNLFSQIKDIDHFELTRKRNGVEETLEYDFE